MKLVYWVALACAGGGFLIATVCLIKTTPLTMMAFFSIGLPLFAAGILVYMSSFVGAIVRGRRGRDF